MGGVKFADFNDLESVKAQVTDKTCAIIAETVQGEGGIYPATKEFLEGLRKLCDEKDIILILDLRSSVVWDVQDIISHGRHTAYSRDT